MKSIFFKKTISALLSGVLLVYPVILFANSHVSLFMQNWVKFNSNDGVQELPTLTITDVLGGTITPANGITIILPKDTEILWERMVTQVKLNGATVDVAYDKTLKKMTVPVSKTFAVSETATITGHKVRVYERAATYKNLGLDVNGDGIVEVEGTNGIQLDDTSRRTDLLPPYPITALTLSQNENSVTLAWENPPDLDFNGLFLTKILMRGTLTNSSDIALTSATVAYTDSDLKKGDIISYKFKTKDFVSNFSEIVTTSAQIPEDSVEIQNSGQEIPLDAENEATVQSQITSVLDSLTSAEIANIASRYKDLEPDKQSFKSIIYLVKMGILKGKWNKLGIAQKLSYSTFAAIVGKALNIEKKGSYLNTFKKIGYIKKTVKGGKKINRKKALQMLLRTKGIDPGSTQALVFDVTEPGYATKEDAAVWIVKLYDLSP